MSQEVSGIAHIFSQKKMSISKSLMNFLLQLEGRVNGFSITKSFLIALPALGQSVIMEFPRISKHLVAMNEAGVVPYVTVFRRYFSIGMSDLHKICCKSGPKGRR